jgi:hypothetical protein
VLPPVLLFRDVDHRPDTGIASSAKVRAVTRAVHKRFCPMPLRVVRGAAAHRTATDFHLRAGLPTPFPVNEARAVLKLLRCT